ncbi:YiiX/YebB-like N1pC/P60 family cysteine hydrolase [Delftia sp. HK171]|uniref:YiiX/YebB-like N1pC/P60 family cysteine hydrolase n=1 Tax=Delftia sp. HK171 TaxID=1920191 RepID=UPI000903963E|nr:YiiX/YebB-like N1pC/P60 family cysteine hydrolase [Delftia sp. HK171]
MENNQYYGFDWRRLKVGDVLLSRGASKQASLISNLTGGDFSHVMLFVGGTLIHADGDGVYSKNPRRIIRNDKNNLAVYRLINDVSSENLKRMCKFARGEIGKLYDVKGAIASIRSGADKSSKDKQFCSRLVAEAFKSIDIDFGKSTDKITPNDFCRFNTIFAKLEQLVVPLKNADVSYANSPDYNLVLQEETFQWLGRVRDFAASKGFSIGSMNDVIDYLFEHPEDDEKICEIVDQTRYYGFVDIDEDKNPYKYDLLQLELEMSNKDLDSREEIFSSLIHGIEEECENRKENYYSSIRNVTLKDLKFFRKSHDLNKRLYWNVVRRAHVIKCWMEYQKFCLKIIERDKLSEE